MKESKKINTFKLWTKNPFKLKVRRPVKVVSQDRYLNFRADVQNKY